MKVILAGIIGLLAALAAVPAVAQDAGFYLGASLGQSKHHDVCEGANLSCDDKDSAWRIFAGYEFSRYVAAEFAYADLGQTAAGANVGGIIVNPTFEATVFELLAVGSVPLMDRLSLLGKLGLYRADSKLGGSGTGFGVTVPLSAEESNSDLTFAFGVRFNFTRNLGLRAEWQRYMGVGGDDTGDTDIDVLSVGLLFRF